MSINLYQTGVSGLLAAQQQLATTGHNIANVNTEGYNRQRAEQNSAFGDQIGGNFFGGGTYVQDITRIYDQFSYKEQLLNQSTLSGADTSFASLNQLNDIMSFSGSAVMSSIERFYQAINGIADNPSDLGLRNIALAQTDVLSSDFRALSDNFDQLEKSTNGEIDQATKRVSLISNEIAKINEQILFNKDLTIAGQPNDLLDKRDQLVSELGEFTKVNTIEDANGVMTVMIGSGTTLVAGITPLQLRVVSGDPDPLQTKLELVGPNSTVAIDEKSIGGSLQGQFDFRDNYLVEARTGINLLAMGISSTLNDAQAEGLDLNQLQGTDLFTDINTASMTAGRVLSPSTNTGTLTAEVVITDVSLVPTDEFSIRFDGANYQMTNLTDGSVTNLGPPGGGTYPTVYGFEFVETGGAPLLDDKYTIRPTESSAALMVSQIDDPASIAASSAVEVTPSDNNISAGKVEVITMADPVTARTMMPMRVDVFENPPASGTYQYQMFDSAGLPTGPVSFYSAPPSPPSVTFDVPALPAVPPAAAGTGLFTIEITGTPTGAGALAPEQYSLDDAFGAGNGSNALKMALTQEQGILNGGKETFSGSLGITTANVGSQTKSAEIVADTAQALYTQAYNRNQETSGVNLDEEAANLLRFQQAYQASSQIISTANTIFDTLLAVAR